MLLEKIANANQHADPIGPTSDLVVLVDLGNTTVDDRALSTSLEKRSRDHAVVWPHRVDQFDVDCAGTQTNIAITELAIAEHETTTDPRPHLDAALAHVDAALTVYDPEHMSRNHANATRLRDGILSRLQDLS